MRTLYWLLIAYCLICLQAKAHAGNIEIQEAAMRGARGKITIRVLDSKGEPVSQAKVSSAFFMTGMNDELIQKETDNKGMASLVGMSKHDLTYKIEKEGFYDTEDRYILMKPEANVKSGEWQPWNPTVEVLLNEKRNPIPMIARIASLTIPAQNIPVGFDFEIGDWVRPYGRGGRNDIFFKYTAEYRGPQEYRKSLLISFDNTTDGMIIMNTHKESGLWSAHEAPPEGYIQSFLLEQERNEDEIKKDVDIPAEKHIVYRTRTITDKQGKISSGMYGKIYHPIEYGQNGNKHRLKFTYYYNPSSSRNLPLLNFRVGSITLPEYFREG